MRNSGYIDFRMGCHCARFGDMALCLVAYIHKLVQ